MNPLVTYGFYLSPLIAITTGVLLRQRLRKRKMVAATFVTKSTSTKYKGRGNPIPSASGPKPVCLIVPAATGTLTLGNVLSTDNGTWLNNPGTFYYQWQRNGVDIFGGIYPTYTVVNADLGNTIHCLVTAWNQYGSAAAYSNDLTGGGGGGTLGRLTFNVAVQSGELILIEDI
jgi:hypothetical protein